LFDDDDHNKHDYYYPNYGYGGMPYYPPYPYRPSYGGGYYPSNGYNRPPGYNSGFVNTGNIVINTDGNRPSGGGYWDRYENRPGANGYQRQARASSPITAAKPNRPELNDLNQRQPRAMPADVRRPSPDATAANWKGQSGYAGARNRDKMSSQERIANAQPGYARPAASKPGSRDLPKAPPKVQGSYAGAKPGNARPASAGKPAPASRDVPKPATRDMPKPSKGTVDRGYDKPVAKPQQVSRPAAQPAQRPAAQRPTPSSRPAPSGNRGTAVSPNRGGQADRAASQRGKQSMPQGARSKGGGGKKQKR
jgi:hypothetical protein